MDDDPPVLLYIMGTGDDRRSPAGRLQHGGFWRAEREWPLARAQATTLFLGPDGTLRRTPPDATPSPHDLHLRPPASRADRSAAISPRTRVS